MSQVSASKEMLANILNASRFSCALLLLYSKVVLFCLATDNRTVTPFSVVFPTWSLQFLSPSLSPA